MRRYVNFAQPFAVGLVISLVTAGCGSGEEPGDVGNGDEESAEMTIYSDCDETGKRLCQNTMLLL